ncbi:unnamed protein product [Medioppia subpectinata]|uniref:Uncharacterized protein n=1 Tax=Medioppia subpectinata TaxID=1979941 RepID=A0A7R9LKC4_9ACAR|nr:unnamed protein product [Medioppia subpectinata]CAG2119565.1 unnamed protein product [Medioppia subpectinata]
MQPGGREPALSNQYRPNADNMTTNGTNGDHLASNLPEDRLFQKLEKASKEDMVTKYFRPMRRDQLLSKVNTSLNKVKLINKTLRCFELSDKTNKALNETNSVIDLTLNNNQTNERINSSEINSRQKYSKSVPLTANYNTDDSMLSATSGSMSAGESPRRQYPHRLDRLDVMPHFNIDSSEISDIKVGNHLSSANTRNHYLNTIKS